MATRRELILQKYKELKEEISLITEKGEILPSADDIDLADYLFMISYQFMNVTSDAEYISTIRGLMEHNDYSLAEDEFQKLFPLIQKFIIWFKLLK